MSAKLSTKLEREEIIKAVVNTLKPLNYVYTLWEGGAAAFNRIDKWSDIDINVVVRDDYVEEVFNSMENALISIREIELNYFMPQPTWHGHEQAFYRLKDSNEYLVIDFVVMKHSNPNKFLEKEIHGDVVVHFDKVFTLPHLLNKSDFYNKIKLRIEDIEKRVDLFQFLVKKELKRKNYIEAFDFYYKVVLDLLVEIIRIKQDPYHYNFKTRYIYYDLPQEEVKKLQDLYFIKDEKDLKDKYNLAIEWLKEELSTVDDKQIKDNLT